jgi:hypothetical protein
MTITRTDRTRWLLLAPVAWIGLALVHPMGGDDAYALLRDKVALWAGVHYAQLVFSLCVAVVLWRLLDAHHAVSSLAARAARVALPIYLVAFAAYDSTTGIGSAMAVHHANSTTDPAARQGAADTVHYLLTNRFSADLSPLHVIASVSFAVAIIGTALVLRHAGLRRSAWLPLAFGVFLTMHAGVGAAIGAACLAVGAWRALSSGRDVERETAPVQHHRRVPITA